MNFILIKKKVTDKSTKFLFSNSCCSPTGQLCFPVNTCWLFWGYSSGVLEGIPLLLPPARMPIPRSLAVVSGPLLSACILEFVEIPCYPVLLLTVVQEVLVSLPSCSAGFYAKIGKDSSTMLPFPTIFPEASQPIQFCKLFSRWGSQGPK